jgi:hypothetical protein
MSADILADFSRRFRFPPKMGGNAEVVTLPCTLVSRLIVIAQFAECLSELPKEDPRWPPSRRDLQREVEWLRNEVAGNMKAPITVAPVSGAGVGACS